MHHKTNVPDKIQMGGKYNNVQFKRCNNRKWLPCPTSSRKNMDNALLLLLVTNPLHVPSQKAIGATQAHHSLQHVIVH